MRVISLSWGRESFALAAMAALGDLPPVDVAVFADTLHEHAGTYQFAERWTAWLESHGVPVVTVRAAQTDLFNRAGGLMIPAYTGHFKVRGQLRRQCTREWKTRPIKRYLRPIAGRDGVDLMIGISLDEFKRVKPSGLQYLRHNWPLMDYGLTRDDCAAWLSSKGLQVPGKSSCVFCPYKLRRVWAAQRTADSDDWRAAVSVDQAIREACPPDHCYLHPDRVPLETLSAEGFDPDRWEDECTGFCGV